MLPIRVMFVVYYLVVGVMLPIASIQLLVRTYVPGLYWPNGMCCNDKQFPLSGIYVRMYMYVLISSVRTTYIKSTMASHTVVVRI